MTLQTEHNQAWRARQRAAGRCLACGEPTDDTRAHCIACREKRKGFEDPAKRRARQNARAERLRAERIAAGHVVRTRRPAAPKPPPRPPLTPAQLSARGKNGGVESGKRRAAALTLEAIQTARRMLLNVRSDFTPAQIADLELVAARVYRMGNDRGYARGRQARYAADRAKASEAA